MLSKIIFRFWEQNYLFNKHSLLVNNYRTKKGITLHLFLFHIHIIFFCSKKKKNFFLIYNFLSRVSLIFQIKLVTTLDFDFANNFSFFEKSHQFTCKNYLFLTFIVERIADVFDPNFFFFYYICMRNYTALVISKI